MRSSSNGLYTCLHVSVYCSSPVKLVMNSSTEHWRASWRWCPILSEAKKQNLDDRYTSILEKGLQATLNEKAIHKTGFPFGGWLRGMQSFWFWSLCFCSVALPMAVTLFRLPDEYILELPNPFEKKSVCVTNSTSLHWRTGRLGRLSCSSQSGIWCTLQLLARQPLFLEMMFLFRFCCC